MPIPAPSANSQLMNNVRKLESNYLAARTRSCGNVNASERFRAILAIRPRNGQNGARRLHEVLWENTTMPHHP